MTLTSRSSCLLLLVSALASFASASPAGLIFQESKCSAGTSSCGAGLPSNFCCSEGTSCIPLAGNTTAMCCPTGQTCEKIQPITCDVSQQDPSKNQQSPIKTSVFDVPLGKCGADLCCPFGYSCSGDDLCVKESDQSVSPEKAAASSTTASPASTTPTNSAPASTEPPSTFSTSLVVAPVTTTPVSSPASSPASSLDSSPASSPTESSPSSPASSSASLPASSSTSSPTADASSATPDSSSSHASNPKTVSIIGGVIGGCAVLVVLGAIAFLFVRRRNLHRKDDYSEKPAVGRIKHLGPGGGRAGSVISDPILQPNSYRTDFIRKSPSIRSSISQGPPQIALNNNNSHQRFSIPNPFDSPSPSNHSNTSPTSYRDSVTSEDERNARTGVVGSGSRLPPIRAMKASSRRVYPQDLHRVSSGENIDVFADPFTMTGNYDRRGTHATTFTDLMIEADLGDVRRGQPYLMPPPMNRI
ncbi:hypothetical protein BBK36DRAFT_1122012 [Trichoderma citrinoviride]|uniref:receptor protein-tyrosine kinase n=1 Tax=Trichoderma citrinoviride TaxID=58853 RepID=A0A2T4B7Z6_9HYPO|nr:hypothetical protein BBK36DRAFT_1122012 [Trichoderma citrinoviride]PTB65408.1 hypothetical protein BBK36DRAFT_1122012 [Trichoderma citrinoviride]